MTTVIVDKAGKIGLPEEALKESRIKPGSELVVLAHDGKIVLLDRERYQKRVAKPVERMVAALKRSLASDPQAPFFGGLTFEQYVALSNEEEQRLWDREYARAKREVKLVERDIPRGFRPAGQKRRSRGAAHRATAKNSPQRVSPSAGGS